MKRLAILLMLLGLGGCGSSRVIDAVTDSIPENANRVRLYSALPPKELYKEVQRGLLEQGYRISDTKEDLLYLGTEAKEVGEQTLLRMNLFVKPAGTGSVLSAQGEWDAALSFGVYSGGLMANANKAAFQVASWNRSAFGQRPTHAFAAMLQALKKIQHDKVECLTE